LTESHVKLTLTALFIILEEFKMFWQKKNQDAITECVSGCTGADVSQAGALDSANSEPVLRDGTFDYSLTVKIFMWMKKRVVINQCVFQVAELQTFAKQSNRITSMQRPISTMVRSIWKFVCSDGDCAYRKRLKSILRCKRLEKSGGGDKPFNIFL